ncbi:MAG: 30S ribosomal protein S17 [Patescibacteria group bacterium]
MPEAKRPKTFKGVVVSDKLPKTRVVKVDRFVKMAKYGKYLKRSKRFKAHDENNEYKLGDGVIIQETRPLSKEKRWKIIAKI